MHGVARLKKRERTSEELERKKKEEELKRIEEYKQVTGNAMKKYRENCLDKEGLDASAAALYLNSEFYTFWNYRRLIFQHFAESKTKEEMDSIYESELRFLEKLQQQSPKSYWLWLHRKWVLLHMNKANWAREMKLIEMLLDRDDRNFHGWDYRRFVAQNASSTLKQELDYTTKKIESNFSNYSAWHQRSAIIPKLYGSNKEELKRVLQEELDLIHNALFTEPSDQSISFYQLWLVERICEIVSEEEKKKILEEELKICLELRELEESGTVQAKGKVESRKWPILISNQIMKKLGGFENKIKENLQLLQQIDPIRSSYYKAQESSV